MTSITPTANMGLAVSALLVAFAFVGGADVVRVEPVTALGGAGWAVEAFGHLSGTSSNRITSSVPFRCRTQYVPPRTRLACV